MSDDAEAERAAVQRILASYLALYSQRCWEEWIDLWAEDGVLEFPFAPAGRRGRYVGKTDILAYMQETSARMAARIRVEGMEYFRSHPMLDPGTACVEMGLKGQVLETGAAYEQKYVSIVEARGGKITLYREYWNPLVSMDAGGGREVWTAAFGAPQTEGAAS